MIRMLLGVLAGVAAGVATVLLAELAAHAIWPPPPGMDPANPDSVREHMSLIPSEAKVAVVVGWGLAAFAGCFAAARIAERPLAIAPVIALLVAAAVFNLYTIPSPAWMWASGVGAILLGGALGGKLGAR